MIKLSKCILLLLLFSGEANFFAQNKKIIIDSIAAKVKEDVYKFSFLSYTACESNEFPKLDSINSELRFRMAYENGRILKNCFWFTERYGSIVKMNLKEVIIDENKNKIFRYLVNRSKSDSFSEIRTTINDKGKFISIINKTYWSDILYKYNENPKLDQVSTELLNDSILAKNKEFAFKAYNKCIDTEIFKNDLSNTTYRSFRKNWKTSLMLECDSIKKKNGDFKNLRLADYLTDSVSTKIYRYKVNFDKLERESEIRIYSAINDKYSGIFVIDVWYDGYFDFKEAVEKASKDKVIKID
ncbi:MAG: hypothetical protein GW839_13660 [Flavobacteriales bacterium]|nr:hypothetical protein [Flavobacteriales bacterium]PIV94020.1 MAG: hypothetical protein COW44_06425 [Flavobacteriaceae bacterium CG17_big_fil_post_rev_8_21_14_2_50_33_15]